MRDYAKTLVVAAGAFLCAEGPAFAFDWDLAVQNRFYLQTLSREMATAQLRYPTLTSSTSATAIAYQLHALGSISGQPAENLILRLGIDTGLIEIGSDGALIDGRDPEEAIERTAFLGETLMELVFLERAIDLKLGKLRPVVGRGAIFNAYALGAVLDADGTLLVDPVPVSLRFGALIPDATFTEEGKQSPLFNLEIAYHFSKRAQVRVIGSFFIEADDTFSPILEDALVRPRTAELAEAQAQVDPIIGYDVETTGWLGWSGVQTEIGIGDLELGAIVLVGFGAVDATVEPNAQFEGAVRAAFDEETATSLLDRNRSEQRISLLSYYLGVDARYALTDDLAIQLFGIAMSGDDGIPSPNADPEPDRDYGGFISLAPLLPKTSIFFGGGVARNLSSPTIASFAPHGAGLLAGGFDVEWFIIDSLRLHALTAAMASSVTHDAYGVEFGLALDAFLLDWMIASVDGGVLIPGQHFADAGVGYQVIAMLRVMFED